MEGPGGYEVFHSLENLHYYYGFGIAKFGPEISDLRDRKLRLQIGLWSLDLKRKFRDVSTSLGQPPISSPVFTFCFNPRHQQLRKLGECILFVQIVDDSGIPLAESTEIVDMQKLNGTINLSIQESTYITGQKQRQFPLCLHTFQYLSLQELEVPFLAQKWGAEEEMLLFADMFPQPYLPSRYGKAASTSAFATVQDVNLSEDILQLYKTKTLLVRASVTCPGHQIVRNVFLGFIKGDEAIWFEDVELGPLHQGSLRIELFTFAKVAARFVESALCQGEKDFSGTVATASVPAITSSSAASLSVNTNSVRFATGQKEPVDVDGIHLVDLVTNISIHEMENNISSSSASLDSTSHSSLNCIQVGQLSLKLFQDHAKHTLRTIHIQQPQGEDILTSIRQVDFPEDDKLTQFGFLFAITCKNMYQSVVTATAAQSSQAAASILGGNTEKTMKKTAAYLKLATALLHLISEPEFFHEKNIHRWCNILLSSHLVEAGLKTLQVFFQDWLVSDTLQLLIERSKDNETRLYLGAKTMGSFLHDEMRWLHQLARAVFALLLSRMTCILGKVPAYDHNHPAEEDGIPFDDAPLMTRAFVHDIAADLLAMLLVYHRKLSQEYLRARDTFVTPSVAIDELFLTVSRHVQVLVKYLSRILPHTDEHNRVMVEDCHVTKDTVTTLWDSWDHRSTTEIDATVRHRLLSLCLEQLLWQTSSLGILQVYYSGLARLHTDMMTHALENIQWIMRHVATIQDGLTKDRRLHDERVNFFLCELISVLIASLTKMLGLAYDQKMVKTIRKQMNWQYFYEDIQAIARILPGESSSSSAAFASVIDPVPSSSNNNDATVDEPDLATMMSPLRPKSALKTPPPPSSIPRPLGLSGRALSLDDFPPMSTPPPASASTSSPIPGSSTAKVSMSLASLTASAAQQPQQQTTTGSRLLRAIQDASPCFTCLLHLFLLLLKRSDVLNEQEHVTAVQLKAYLNSVLYSVVNAPTAFRPTSINLSLQVYFAGPSSTHEDVRKGLLSLVDLICCIDRVYYAALCKRDGGGCAGAGAGAVAGTGVAMPTAAVPSRSAGSRDGVVVDVPAILQDMYLSLSFYLAFGQMVTDHVLHRLRVPTTSSTTTSTTSTSAAGSPSLVQLMEHARQLRDGLLACVHTIVDEIFSLLPPSSSSPSSSSADPSSSSATNSAPPGAQHIDALYQCLESAVVVWKHLAGIPHLCAMVPALDTSSQSLATVWCTPLHLQQHFQRTWQLLLRLYALPDHPCEEAGSASWQAARLQLLSSLLEVIDVRPVDLLAAHDGDGHHHRRSNHLTTLLSSVGKKNRRWLQRLRQHMHVYFRQHLSATLSHLSRIDFPADTVGTSLMALARELLASPAPLPPTATVTAQPSEATMVTESTADATTSLAVHALLVDVVEALRMAHEDALALVDGAAATAAANVCPTSLFAETQQWLLQLRTTAMARRAAVPAIASPIERPLCQQLLAIAGAVPLVLTENGLVDTRATAMAADPRDTLRLAHRLAQWQRQLAALKRLFAPFVRIRTLKNGAVSMDDGTDAPILEDNAFTWAHFTGRSEYAFVSVWQFLVYLNVNLLRLRLLATTNTATATSAATSSSSPEMTTLMAAFVHSLSTTDTSSSSVVVTAGASSSSSDAQLAMHSVKWQVQLQDKEVQSLRDAVTQLLTTGYWELAAKLVDFYSVVIDWQQQYQQQVVYPLLPTTESLATGLQSPPPLSQSAPGTSMFSPLASTSTSADRSRVFTFDATTPMTPLAGSPAKSLLQAGLFVKGAAAHGGGVPGSGSAGSVGLATPNPSGTLSPMHSPLGTARFRKQLPPPPPLPSATATAAAVVSPVPSHPTTTATANATVPAPPATATAASSSSSLTSPSILLSSPKRNDMLKKELHRMHAKIHEKLKFDRDVRLPTSYVALHFTASVPLLFTVDTLRQCLDPLILLRADIVTSTMTAQANGLYEQWFVVKLDMAAYAACRDYYLHYVQTAQHAVADYARTGHASHLQHPLHIASLMHRLTTTWPEFTIVPPHYDVGAMAASVAASSIRTTTAAAASGGGAGSTAVDGAAANAADPTATATATGTAAASPGASAGRTDLLHGLVHPQEIATLLPPTPPPPRGLSQQQQQLPQASRLTFDDSRQTLRFVQLHPLCVADVVDASRDDNHVFTDKAKGSRTTDHGHGRDREHGEEKGERDRRGSHDHGNAEGDDEDDDDRGASDAEDDEIDGNGGGGGGGGGGGIDGLLSQQQQQQDEDDGEDDDEDNEVIQSQDLNEIVDSRKHRRPTTAATAASPKVRWSTRAVRRHLDRTHVDFTRFPSAFYVYVPLFRSSTAAATVKPAAATAGIPSSDGGLIASLFASALTAQQQEQEVVRVTLRVTTQSLAASYPRVLHEALPGATVTAASTTAAVAAGASVQTTRNARNIPATAAAATSLLGSKRGTAAAGGGVGAGGGKAQLLPTAQDILRQALQLAEQQHLQQLQAALGVASGHDGAVPDATVATGNAAADQHDDDAVDNDVDNDGDNDTAHPDDRVGFQRDFLSRITPVALSPWNLAQVHATEALGAAQAAREVLFHQTVLFARGIRVLRHLLSLKTTEWTNQPEHSLLHTDNAFAYVTTILAEALQQPAARVVGMHNIEHIIVMERERHEVRWQAIRKHGKREFMRQLAVYEATVAATTATTTSAVVTTTTTRHTPAVPPAKAAASATAAHHTTATAANDKAASGAAGKMSIAATTNARDAARRLAARRMTTAPPSAAATTTATATAASASRAATSSAATAHAPKPSSTTALAPPLSSVHTTKQHQPHAVTVAGRPIEPDWDTIRRDFDRAAGKSRLDALSVLSQHCWRQIRRLLHLLRKVVEKIQEMASSTSTGGSAGGASSGTGANGGGGRDAEESRGSVAAASSARHRQLSKFSATVGVLDAAEEAARHGVDQLRPVDTELRVKQKLLLYLEALYAATDIGIDLS